MSSVDERVAAYAQAIADELPTFGPPLDHVVVDDLARAAIAVADAELASLRGEK